MILNERQKIIYSHVPADGSRIASDDLARRSRESLGRGYDYRTFCREIQTLQDKGIVALQSETRLLAGLPVIISYYSRKLTNGPIEN